MPNLRYTPRGRPQSLQRRTRRVENLGSRRAMAILDLLATDFYLLGRVCSNASFAAPRDSGSSGAQPPQAAALSSRLKGIPSRLSNSNDSRSLEVVVTRVMFIPCGRVYLSGFSSGNTNCSDKPRL